MQWGLASLIFYFVIGLAGLIRMGDYKQAMERGASATTTCSPIHSTIPGDNDEAVDGIVMIESGATHRKSFVREDETGHFT